MRVYVVRGDCSEYSSYQFWEVKAFADEAKANSLCAELNAWCLANGCHRSQEKTMALGARRPDECPLDPAFATDYTGTSYEVWSIDVEGAP